MQNKLLASLLAATLITCGARAQNTASASQAATASPGAVPPRAPAPAQPVSTTFQAAPTPNQVIYAPRLPTADELTKVAAAQGLSIEQINQTARQVTVIFKGANGETNTVAYQLLPTGPAVQSTTVLIPATPPPTVIYREPPHVVYYRSYDPYWNDPFWDDDDFWPPVSLNLGFGFYHGWGGGYGHEWHGGGGFHHHWR